VLVIENFGRDDTLVGLPLNDLSSILLLILFVLVVVKILVRHRLRRLIVYPVEYLVMLIVLSVPLLPHSVTAPFHLFSVTAKSLILFVGFKLVLTRQTQNNYMIILLIVVSALVLVLTRMLSI
jgi:UDP-GlcNAc:undecaprenyl-phosphate/decaprenyl-phosphate GlcNAc-1-phosphate transferase